MAPGPRGLSPSLALALSLVMGGMAACDTANPSLSQAGRADSGGGSGGSDAGPAGAGGAGGHVPTGCVPGKVETCPCPGGGSSTQTRTEDGVFGPCGCEEGDATTPPPPDAAVDTAVGGTVVPDTGTGGKADAALPPDTALPPPDGPTGGTEPPPDAPPTRACPPPTGASRPRIWASPPTRPCRTPPRRHPVSRRTPAISSAA